MPAIITHHLFGEEASHKQPEGLALAEEELLAFLLGNQGSDPFSFCMSAMPTVIKSTRRMAKHFHGQPVVEALCAARDAVACLPPEDQGVGRAFTWGLLAHYLLDSEAHAFILAQENALCAAGYGLEDAHKEVHAIIESELDTWMLWSLRRQTIADVPAWTNLARTDRVTRAAGALFSQVAWQVFGKSLRPDSYGRCLADYERFYRIVDPTGNTRGRALAKAGELAQHLAHLEALSHTDAPTENCPAANLNCRPWIDPLTGEEKTTSFPDVFYGALESWPGLIEAYESGERDALERLVLRDYWGNPISQG